MLEYVAKFIELARFADDYVATSMTKVRKFEDGLKLSILGKIAGLLLQDLDSMVVDTRFSTCVPTRWARLAFLLLENHFKKRFGVATYFCFILKGKNKIRKKNPKCDS